MLSFTDAPCSDMGKYQAGVLVTAAAIRIGIDGPLNTCMVPGQRSEDMGYRAHTPSGI